MDKLDKLEKIVEILQTNHPTNDDMAQIFEALIKSFKEAVSAMEERVANGERGMTGKQGELMKKSEDILKKWEYLSSLEDKGKGMEASHAEMTKKMEGQMAKIQTLADTLKSIKTSDLSLEAANLTEKRIRPLIPKISYVESFIKNYALKMDEEYASFVKKTEAEIEKLKKEVSTKSSGGARRVFQPYVDDFSGSTDGVTKTFYLSREPLKTNSFMVYGTDFPTILRPTIDFTVNGKILTLTSQVAAPSLGATLLATYYA